MSTDATAKRRASKYEVVAVLAVSAFGWAAYALVNFVYITLRTPARSPVAITSYPQRFDVYAFANTLIGDLVNVAPVLIVLYLFAGAKERVGIRYDRRDIPFGLALAAAALAISLGLINAGRALGLAVHPIVPVNTNASVSYVVLFFVGAASAAVSEEMIVNAYLLRRLGDLGWNADRALVASAVLRGSYHLYQGVQGFVTIGLAGLVLGRIFQRSGRIVAPIVAHFAFDAVGFLGYWLLAKHVGWL